MIFHSLIQILCNCGWNQGISYCRQIVFQMGQLLLVVLAIAWVGTWRWKSCAASHGSQVFTRIMIDAGKSQISYIMATSLFPTRCKGFVSNLSMCHMLL